MLFLANCSLNHPVSMWEVEKDNKDNDTKLNFEYDLSYEQFKKNVILYGKKNNFPKLDE